MPEIAIGIAGHDGAAGRSEEHTSELQSQSKLVCRLLLEKKTPSDAGRRGVSRPFRAARGIAQGRRRGAVRARGLRADRSREQGRGARVLRAPLSWVCERRRSDFHFRSPPPMELTFGCGFTQLSKMPALRSVFTARRETSL